MEDLYADGCQHTDRVKGYSHVDVGRARSRPTRVPVTKASKMSKTIVDISINCSLVQIRGGALFFCRIHGSLFRRFQASGIKTCA
jgi:hypothetical protein